MAGWIKFLLDIVELIFVAWIWYGFGKRRGFKEGFQAGAKLTLDITGRVIGTWVKQVNKFIDEIKTELADHQEGEWWKSEGGKPPWQSEQ